MMRVLVLLLSIACSLAACDDDLPPRTRPSDPDAGTKPDKPMTAQAVAAAKKATAAATKLKAGIEGGVPNRGDYIQLRYNVAVVKPFARISAQVGAEVLFGPPRSADEAGGALALLDRALADGDMAAAKKQIEQCIRSLRLIDNELMLNDVPPDAAVRVLSDVAFEVGLMLMEAYQGVPDAADAVKEDILGTLFALQSGVDTAMLLSPPKMREAAKPAVEAVTRLVAELNEAVAAAGNTHMLKQRAALVRKSGALGVQVRRAVKAFGETPKLPYPARYPVANNDPLKEPITPLVVPAPRTDLRRGDRKAIAALGEALFRDKRLSRGEARGCVDCHQPDKGFTDGLPTPPSLDPASPVVRNTPTLLYAPLHAAQLWDGQFASAERQAIKVIHEKSEMGLSRGELERVVAGIADYDARFSKLFDDGVTAKNIARALVAYQIRDLVPAQSPMDRYARGDDAALDDTLHLGFDLFVGRGRCGRCHVPPLFGGSRPTDFATPIFAALGVPEGPDHKQLDDDLGRAKITKSELDAHAFKTPTVRNIHLTAPYFHNGSYPTLEAVVDFYEKGGGPSLGIEIDNLDPDVRKLELSDAQRAALIAFMRVGLADERK